MRSREEIERALKIIQGVWEAANRHGDQNARITSEAAINALQWVLKAAEAERFGALLASIEKDLDRMDQIRSSEVN